MGEELRQIRFTICDEMGHALLGPFTSMPEGEQTVLTQLADEHREADYFAILDTEGADPRSIGNFLSILGNMNLSFAEQYEGEERESATIQSVFLVYTERQNKDLTTACAISKIAPVLRRWGRITR